MPLKHFGLREEPFGVAPDPRFLYFGNEHREAISALYTSMLEGRSAALLLAHPGMGKTTLLNYLRARVAATADMVVLSNFADSRRGLLHEVTSLLGCEAEVDNAGENWRRLQRVLIDRARRGRRVVLICDDAQTLSHEALEDLNLLCNCELPQQKLIQIILAGQPGLVPRLRIPRHESLTQRIGVFSHLMPLPPGEVEQYIEHRLRVAGATREVFTPEARLAVARFSDGVPIRINTVCRKALVDSCLAHCNHVEPDIVEEAASDLLNSVYPAQVVEEAVWAQLAPQTRTLPPPAEPLAEWRDEEELTRDDIARRVRSLDKQVVMLKQLGGASNGGAIPGVQSASARPSPPMALSSPATPRWQVSRNFELLLRMERDRDLFGPEPPQPLAAPAGWGTAGDTVRHREPLVPALSALRGLTCAEPERCVLENRILDAAPGGACQTIALSAAGRGESAALVLVTLAQNLGQRLGYKVVIVEMNNRPLRRILDLPATPGLDAWVRSGVGDLAALAQPTGFENVWALVAGDDPEVVHGVHHRFADLTTKLRDAFGMVLYELPPASDRRQPLDLHARADTVLLVAKPGSSRVRDVERAMRRLAREHVRVAGTILDDIELWTNSEHEAGTAGCRLCWPRRFRLHASRSKQPMTTANDTNATSEQPGRLHGGSDAVTHAADA